MKITFLGTADGLPRPGHFRASTMIEVSDRLYLIDGGAPIIDLILANGKRPEQLKAFFNTHPHTDHVDGMLSLITLVGWTYPTVAFELHVPDPCVTDAYVAYFETVTGGVKYPHDRLKNVVYSAGEIYDDGFLKVTAIPTRHCEPRPSYAFIVEAEGKRVLFSGDLSQFLKKGDFPEIVLNEPFDLFVCEMAHFGEEHIAPYLEKCKARRVMFNHYQPQKESHIESLSKPDRFPFPVSMAHDGESVEI